MKIEGDMSGAGGHVARIEGRIRTIKERVRAHTAYKLPCSLTALGLAMLVSSHSLFDGPHSSLYPSHVTTST